jgi:mono/diheme cytochrome c family protein
MYGKRYKGPAMTRLTLALTVLLLAPAAWAAPPDHLVARGDYIVNRLGMCSDCHTPRTAQGQLDTANALKGAPIDLTPNHPIPGFAKMAPPIAGGLPHYTDAELVTFLETGKRPDGSFAAPPMPPYRMDRQDARAVVAYLKSLPR